MVRRISQSWKSVGITSEHGGFAYCTTVYSTIIAWFRQMWQKDGSKAANDVEHTKNLQRTCIRPLNVTEAKLANIICSSFKTRWAHCNTAMFSPIIWRLIVKELPVVKTDAPKSGFFDDDGAAPAQVHKSIDRDAVCCLCCSSCLCRKNHSFSVSQFVFMLWPAVLRYGRASWEWRRRHETIQRSQDRGAIEVLATPSILCGNSTENFYMMSRVLPWLQNQRTFHDILIEASHFSTLSYNKTTRYFRHFAPSKGAFN